MLSGSTEADALWKLKSLSQRLIIRNVDIGGAAEHRLSFQAFLVNVAEDVVFWSGGSDGQIEILVSGIQVQIAIGSSMDNQNVYVWRQ